MANFGCGMASKRFYKSNGETGVSRGFYLTQILPENYQNHFNGPKILPGNTLNYCSQLTFEILALALRDHIQHFAL